MPAQRFEYHEWLKQAVNIDYHIQAYKHYYSVPYIWYGKSVSIVAKEKTIEIYHKAKRIATHMRDDKPYTYTTLTEHMPLHHQKHIEWMPRRLILWAKKTGNNIGALIEKIIMSKVHPQQGFRPALGIILINQHIVRLGKSFGNDRLEQAAELALRYNLTRVRQISEILKKGLDKKVNDPNDAGTVINKENIRGPQYYQKPDIKPQPNHTQRSQIL